MSERRSARTSVKGGQRTSPDQVGRDQNSATYEGDHTSNSDKPSRDAAEPFVNPLDCILRQTSEKHVHPRSLTVHRASATGGLRRLVLRYGAITCGKYSASHASVRSITLARSITSSPSQ